MLGFEPSVARIRQPGTGLAARPCLRRDRPVVQGHTTLSGGMNGDRTDSPGAGVDSTLTLELGRANPNSFSNKA